MNVLILITRLPMQKIFTQVKQEGSNMQQVEIRPRQSTVEFIKQFARVYSFNPFLKVGLGGFIAN